MSGSKSLTSPAILTSWRLVSKRVIRPMPERPSRSALHVLAESLPTRVTMPVTGMAPRVLILRKPPPLAAGASGNGTQLRCAHHTARQHLSYPKWSMPVQGRRDPARRRARSGPEQNAPAVRATLAPLVRICYHRATRPDSSAGRRAALCCQARRTRRTRPVQRTPSTHWTRLGDGGRQGGRGADTGRTRGGRGREARDDEAADAGTAVRSVARGAAGAGGLRAPAAGEHHRHGARRQPERRYGGRAST